MESLPIVIISISVLVFALVAIQPLAEYAYRIVSKRVKDAQKKYIVNDKSYLFEAGDR